MIRFHTDLESYSEVDLKKVGLDNYSKHESTRITMGAWAIGDVAVQQTDDVELYLREVEKARMHPDVLFYAFNAPFERTMLREVGGVDIPIERWRCTMVHAYTLAFSGGLADVGKQLGLPADKQKLARGLRLLHKFRKPAPKNHLVEYYNKENAPEDWAEFCEYNRMDVVAEREIEMLLSRYPVPDREWELWFIDQRINDRGLPIDRELVDAAIKVYHAEKRHLAQQLRELTGLENPNSVQQLHSWFQAMGYPMVSFSAEDVRTAIWHLEQTDGDLRIIEALKLRQQLARSAGAKWEAFLRMTDWDTGRLRHVFQFAGAQRTWRWAGRGLQPHNLHRSPPDQDRKVQALLTGDNEWVRMLYGNVMDVVASCIRAGIAAPKGKKLVVCDLGSIESRKLGWASGCKRINKIFEEGKDTYKDFAQDFYHKPYDEITKEERTFCKPPVLGCGYRLGAGGLVKYAEGMGVEMSGKDAKKAVRTFRNSYPEVEEMWRWLDDATKQCVRYGITYEGYSIRIRRDDQFMFIDLPSGRSLAYYQPLVEPRTIKIPDPETGEEREWHTEAVTYMGMNQFNHQWSRISSHGGKFTENFDQAESRDVLSEGMRLAENNPLLEVVGHVHDEIICLADEANSEVSLQCLNADMVVVPEYTPGLLLAAEGYIADRYRKE